MIDSPSKKAPLFSEDKISAVDAISKAQYIAFAPYIFQASVLLRDFGILQAIDQSKKEGLTIPEVCKAVNKKNYAVRVLLEAGLGIGLVYRKEGKYILSKTGHFFINHQMAVVNTDFMRDVCYDGAQNLRAALEEGKPAGLYHLGNWDTIYQGLSLLPEPAKTSWFNFDHYYSDNAFPEAMAIVFAGKPKKVMDIGANTGKFSLACLAYDPQVDIGLVDLQIQLNVAKENIEAAGYGNRVTYNPRNVLDKDAKLPTGYDVIWMSQFLDCFADDEIISILQKCHEALPAHGRIFINETFWDVQRFDASAFSLQMTSLYFTTMANGNSQMYDSEVFFKLIDKAGFKVVHQHDDIGLSHTILEIQKK
ncbi:MAG: methyltransferase [Bacteroidetes bacterium]|nr:methyltransferase [Bacteroidota bacterium]